MSKTLGERTKNFNEGYNHSLGLLLENRESKSTASLIVGIEKDAINRFRTRKLRPLSITPTVKNEGRYNKYYVDPRFQFKSRVENPKSDKQMLNNEHYIYSNLRNE